MKGKFPPIQSSQDIVSTFIKFTTFVLLKCHWCPSQLVHMNSVTVSDDLCNILRSSSSQSFYEEPFKRGKKCYPLGDSCVADCPLSTFCRAFRLAFEIVSIDGVVNLLITCALMHSRSLDQNLRKHPAYFVKLHDGPIPGEQTKVKNLPLLARKRWLSLLLPDSSSWLENGKLRRFDARHLRSCNINTTSRSVVLSTGWNERTERAIDYGEPTHRRRWFV